MYVRSTSIYSVGRAEVVAWIDDFNIRLHTTQTEGHFLSTFLEWWGQEAEELGRRSASSTIKIAHSTRCEHIGVRLGGTPKDLLVRDDGADRR